MARRLGSLVERYTPGLELDIYGNGTSYTVPLASAELGLWCRTAAALAGQAAAAGGTDEAIAAAGDQAPPLPEGLTFEQWVLGTAYDKMVADGVESPFIEFCAKTAFIWHSTGDEDRTEAFWNAGGDPEQMGPPKKPRRASTGAKSTAAAGGTRKRATTSGTTSPRPRKKAAPKTR